MKTKRDSLLIDHGGKTFVCQKVIKQTFNYCFLPQNNLREFTTRTHKFKRVGILFIFIKNMG